MDSRRLKPGTERRACRSTKARPSAVTATSSGEAAASALGPTIRLPWVVGPPAPLCPPGRDIGRWWSRSGRPGICPKGSIPLGWAECGKQGRRPDCSPRRRGRRAALTMKRAFTRASPAVSRKPSSPRRIAVTGALKRKSQPLAPGGVRQADGQGPGGDESRAVGAYSAPRTLGERLGSRRRTSSPLRRARPGTPLASPRSFSCGG